MTPKTLYMVQVRRPGGRWYGWDVRECAASANATADLAIQYRYLPNDIRIIPFDRRQKDRKP